MLKKVNTRLKARDNSCSLVSLLINTTASPIPQDIVGLDFRNPLLEDARLALELRCVRKREFRSREHALSFYRRYPDGPPGSTAGSDEAPLAFPSLGALSASQLS